MIRSRLARDLAGFVALVAAVWLLMWATGALD